MYPRSDLVYIRSGLVYPVNGLVYLMSGLVYPRSFLETFSPLTINGRGRNGFSGDFSVK